VTGEVRTGTPLTEFWLDELLAGITRYPDVGHLAAAGDYLITGGDGCLGSQVAGLLAVLRERRVGIGEIFVLDLFPRGVSPLTDYLRKSCDVALIEADIVQPLSHLPKVDNIIHLASIPSPTWFRRNPISTVLVNTIGAVNIFDYAEKSNASRVMHISSSGVYGNLPATTPWREDMTGSADLHDQRACYDESKRLAETICAEAHRVRGIPVTVIRPFNAYGPGQRRDDGRIVPHLIEEAISGGPLHLETDGSPRRCFCYSVDVAAAMLLATGSDLPWEDFNVGSTEDVSMAELARLVSDCRGIGAGCIQFQSMPERGGGSGPQARYPSIAAIGEKYGWKPSISLAEGIHKTIRYHELLRAG